ncbi:MAG TPA: transcription-repair coupling factor [Salinivirgaceae bacterium]|nr:transcription-repair coupling factor [Salinivirgaceae bacterium]HQA75773.1 transcription-repair coupling factor [Salinivirgaceae bacterium]
MTANFNLSILFEKYQKHKNISLLLEKFSETDSVSLSGLNESAFSFFLFAVFKKSKSDVFVIANDREEAAYLHNEAQSVLGDENCCLLVSDFKRAAIYGQHDPESALLRGESIRKIVDTKREPLFIVTYPESLIETTVSKGDIVSNTISLHKNENISPDFLTDLLLTYNFTYVDFVYEPGQFAVRGGIVDVFSFSNISPYRIDFMGDTVDTIRVFDIETQISEYQVDSMSIIPNLGINKNEGNRVPISHILHENTIIVYDDYRFTESKLKFLWETSIEKENELEIDIKNIVTNADELLKNLDRFPTIHNIRNIGSDTPFTFQTEAQPSFSKNFELLQQTIVEYNKLNYEVLIVSEQQKQIDRIDTILNQIDSTISFHTTLGTVHKGFIDHDLKICLFTDHQIFDRYHKYRVKLGFTRKEALTLNDITSLHPGDYVVHIDHGVGYFGGLEKIEVNGKIQEVIKLVYRDNDTLFVNIHALHKISKYKGKDAVPPKIHKLGSALWQNTKNKAKSKIKDIARELISLYAERLQQPGYSFSADSYLNQQLEASFIYEDTPDQEQATKAVKSDMENSSPMDRLVCGDVGFGKTEVAIRAAFKAACDNKQTAVLVPTTILAFQHMKTFTERLKDFPVRIEYVSRMRSSKEVNSVLHDLKSGLVDIIIGTHRLVSNDVQFKDLGLLIIDEEQKFGVKTKEKLRAMKVNVDTLTLTATPIPRTLQFSLMGARDLSIIKTPPPNRLPITTEIHTFDTNIIMEAIDYETNRGGQVFFVHNRIQNIVEVEKIIKNICPKARVVHAHGQMEGRQLEKIMLEFIDEKYDVLVATTIIESGLDIPNANTIIINDAHNFGLSDLHQLRGRVGRSNRKAFCYLLTPPLQLLPAESRRRLQAIESFSELGSGLNIALQDLDIRGAGNLLGGEQSGFISQLGYEAYQTVLQEAVLELKEQEFKNLLGNNANNRQVKNIDTTRDCQIDTDLEVLFPDSYISNIAERIKLYKQLDNITTKDELQQFSTMLIDRFGKIPKETEELINVVKLRRKAVTLGFEKIVIKQQKMICYFISDQKSDFFDSQMFQNMLLVLQREPNLAHMQEHAKRLRLVIENVKSVSAANKLLDVFLGN